MLKAVQIPVEKTNSLINEITAFTETYVSLDDFLKQYIELFVKYGSVKKVYASFQKYGIDVGTYSSFAARFGKIKKEFYDDKSEASLEELEKIHHHSTERSEKIQTESLDEELKDTTKKLEHPETGSDVEQDMAVYLEAEQNTETGKSDQDSETGLKGEQETAACLETAQSTEAGESGQGSETDDLETKRKGAVPSLLIRRERLKVRPIDDVDTFDREVLIFMKKILTFVGGSKGGTGKSLVCMGLVDYLRKTFPMDDILLFETDATNPDVGRLYKKTKGIVVENLALNEHEDNWSSFIDIIDQSKARHVVVNSMAGANIGVEAQGYFLNEAIDDEILNVDFKCLWVMNKDKDSVDLLGKFMEQIKHAVIFPVKNLWFGKEFEFNYYNESNEGKLVREMVLKRGGMDLTLPTLNQKLTYKLYTQQINFDEIRETVSGGMRISLSHWVNQVGAMFESVYIKILRASQTAQGGQVPQGSSFRQEKMGKSELVEA
jgi:hypothetical protein